MSHIQRRSSHSHSRFQSSINYDDNDNTEENNLANDNSTFNKNEPEKLSINKQVYERIIYAHDNVLEFLNYQNNLIHLMEKIVNGQVDDTVYNNIEQIVNEKSNFLKDNLELFKQKLLLDESLKKILSERKFTLNNENIEGNSEKDDTSTTEKQLETIKHIIKKRNDIQDIYCQVKNQISKDPKYVKKDIRVLKYEESNLSEKIVQVNQDIKATEELNNQRLERITKLYAILDANNSKEQEQADVELDE
ncbi:hypothetical protein HANVADRAFT_53287 [Hanseniaspora valbyensis NRRL Y-1626]|uniref:Uncharacterized protein n=1 Tax=Hanseniaspora valbyensis NRRL Y-1626 TaxID=766949 RepID=A0A1B7TBX3_9ASCO|nr:hypothetical protein HANVADRAFT_53287 [Hanseniaspora valbyensis NRRL Y-1626]